MTVLDDWSSETKQIHAGQTADPTTRARALPIHPSTSHTFLADLERGFAATAAS